MRGIKLEDTKVGIVKAEDVRREAQGVGMEDDKAQAQGEGTTKWTSIFLDDEL